MEKAERGKNAQLAYSFDIALQNELTMEDNIALARQFVREQFVAKGMIADLAIHALEKDGGIQNPHFHVMCPIRPLNPDGTWGQKQKRVYRLDADGNKILGKNGKPLFDAIPTTDWGKRETLESWRKAWADMVNAKFAEKSLDCQIDHRSNKERGIEQAPTIHEGPAVKQMEQRGEATEKGDLNRWLKATNSLLSSLLRKLVDIVKWIREIKEKLEQPEPPNLAQLLLACHDHRNSKAWSNAGKIRNLQELAKIIIYVDDNNIHSLDDLLSCVKQVGDNVQALKKSMKEKQDRIKELRNLLRYEENYRNLLPLFEQMNAIKWKGKRNKFYAEHRQEINLFYVSRRKLKEQADTGGKYSVVAWKQEIAKLDHQRKAEYEKYKEINENFQHLLKVKYWVDTAIHQQEEELRRATEQNQAYQVQRITEAR